MKSQHILSIIYNNIAALSYLNTKYGESFDYLLKAKEFAANADLIKLVTYNMAIVNEKLDMTESSVQIYQNLLQSHPDMIECHLRLGDFLLFCLK